MQTSSNNQASNSEPRRSGSTSSAERESHAQRTERSDARMFDAATRLIVEQGTHKTTLKAVGELAGYSRGLAGSRFSSKAGLLSFVVRQAADYWLQEVQATIGDKCGYQAICAIIDAHYQFCKKTPVPVRAFYILWFESIGVDNEISKTVLFIHKRRLDDVVKWINRGIEAGEISARIDSNAVARNFLTMMTGIIYQWLIDPNQDAEIKQLHDQLKLNLAQLLKDPKS